MRNALLSLICLVNSVLNGADFQAVEEDFKQKKYHSLLDEYATAARDWLEEGRFDDYLDKRPSSAQEQYVYLQKEACFKKRWAGPLSKIEEEKNESLRFLCDRYPDVAITRMVRDILTYHQLQYQHAHAMTFF